MVIVTDTLLTAKCLQLLSYKKGPKVPPLYPPTKPTSGTTLFPHVIQGHGQLAESPLCDRLFVMIMHLVIHQTLLPWKTKRKKSVNRKKGRTRKTATRKWKDHRKIFWLKMQRHENSSGSAHELVVRIFKRQLWWTETFANASVI